METLAIISIYRGTGVFFLTILYFAINVFVWERAQLNYTHLFHMRSTSPRKSYRIFVTSAVLFCIWGCSLYLCAGGKQWDVSLFGIPYWVHPVVLFVGLMFVFLLPFDVLGRSGRFWLLGSFGRVVFCACVPRVVFRDFFVADQLNSLVILLQDLAYSFCYLASDQWFGTSHCTDANTVLRPIIAVLPALSRFIHCVRRWRVTGDKFPHLANAAKYSCAFFVVIFGNLAAHVPVSDYRPLHTTWACVAVFASLFNWIWDVKMDWGLLQRGSRHVGLRPLLKLRFIPAYYFAIVANFAMRFAWALSITPIATLLASEYLLLLVSLVELTRRFMWNFFRLEWEQISTVAHSKQDYDHDPAAQQLL